MWQHPAFTITATQAVRNICGGLTYVSDEAYHVVTDQQAIHYSGSQMKHTISTDNVSFAGAHYYKVSSYLTKFASLGKAEVSGMLTIEDPCADPFYPITSDVPLVVHPYYGTTQFQFPVSSVKPGCVVTYSCTYNAGPYTGSLNLCSFFTPANGQSSTGTFDVISG